MGYGNYTAVPATATASCALDSIAVRYREHIDKSKSIITMLDCDARKSQSALPYIHPLPPDRADILGAYIIGLLNVSEPILMNRRLCRADLVRIMIKMCTCTDRLFIDSLTVLQRILQSWLQHSRNFFFETSSKSSSNNSILMLKSQLNTYFYKSE